MTVKQSECGDFTASSVAALQCSDIALNTLIEGESK